MGHHGHVLLGLLELQWDAPICPPFLLAPCMVPDLAVLCGCLWDIPCSRGWCHFCAQGSTGLLMDQSGTLALNISSVQWGVCGGKAKLRAGLLILLNKVV